VTAMTQPSASNASANNMLESLEAGKMIFQIGDRVSRGVHMSALSRDVGTVLIQVKTSEGTSRVVCPWELVLMAGFT